STASRCLRWRPSWSPAVSSRCPTPSLHGCRARCRICSPSTFKAAPTTSRPIRSPISTLAWRKNDKDFFKRNFGGKIVLIGTVLDVEDRKITSKRFATAPEGARAERCALQIPVASQTFARDSIAGVYIHATAVNNLVRDDGLIEFGRIGAAIASFALAATAAFVLGSVSAAAATVGLGVTWIAGATVALRYALALPLIEPLLASLAALGATIGYRFMIADKGKRLLRQSFALYRAGGDRKNALLQQAAGAGRRD